MPSQKNLGGPKKLLNRSERDLKGEISDLFLNE